VVWLRDALLCDAGRSISAATGRRQGRRHHYKSAAHGPISKGPPGSPTARRPLSRARFDFRWEDSSTSVDPETARSFHDRPGEGRPQGRAFLLDVRPKILLDEDNEDVRDYAATVNDPRQARGGRGAVGMSMSGVIEMGWRQMMPSQGDGGQVILMREKVKESKSGVVREALSRHAG